MKIIKNILITLGILFVCGAALFGFLNYKSAGFKKEHAPFVTRFMTEFSKNWEIAEVRNMLSNDFVRQLETPNARQAMLFFKQLGKLTAIRDVELQNYRANAGTDTYQLGEFVFKADFENASGLVTMSVIVKKDGERVNALYVNPTTEINNTPAKTLI
ncbi:hypothetical protein ACUUL3_00290 [Thiovibrio sp. JS02]